MKRSCIAIIIIICAGSTLLFGQFDVKLKHAEILPNLVIKEFSLTDQGVKSGEFMKYKFRLRISNTGAVNITKPFYFTVQVKTENMSTFNMTDNHHKFLHLDAGQNSLMEKTISLNIQYVSGKTVEIRGFIDSGGDKEMPPAYRDVKESNEDDNYSDVITIAGDYTPNIVSIKPLFPVSGLLTEQGVIPANENVRIDGTGFGSTQGQHTIALFPLKDVANPKTVNITNWSGGVIDFTIPATVETGRYVLAIVDKNTMGKKSNVLTINVCVRRVKPWPKIVTFWNELKDAFFLRIHTWGGRAEYKNESTIKIIGSPDTLEVEEIKLSLDTGRYRYYINDFNAKPGGISLHRLSLDDVRLLDNELRMQVLFESQKLEIKGYFQALGSKSWKDHGAPDLDIDNAKLSVILSFSFKNGQLDYQTPSVYFNADIDARDPAADWFMDAFAGGWDSQIITRVRKEIGNAFSSNETKQNICDSFLGFIIGSINLSKGKIVDVKFTSDDILVTYYRTD